MSSFTITSDTIDAHLRSAWKAMTDDASLTAKITFTGRIDSLKALGLLSADFAELWEARINMCPGHDATRVWCAYCGDICRQCGEPSRGRMCPAGAHHEDCCDFSLDECHAKLEGLTDE